ncbi:hypothetical protein CFIO01_09028 [Colletotrichum fioriniae PJ7]|uniref:Uncharacterized protein n=1 Tax=Colletotrichum fioriniae PJ7 TaxID=1445577 RepID=A0A010QRR3_9PEZI|nr:hypothetical protein CFIO01_09028 [Colletotrichum fioriniae PJ7]
MSAEKFHTVTVDCDCFCWTAIVFRVIYVSGRWQTDGSPILLTYRFWFGTWDTDSTNKELFAEKRGEGIQLSIASAVDLLLPPLRYENYDDFSDEQAYDQKAEELKELEGENQETEFLRTLECEDFEDFRDVIEDFLAKQIRSKEGCKV